MKVARKNITKILLFISLYGLILTMVGCSKTKSEDDSQNKQSQESVNTVTAEYDVHLEAILGDGLIYEILEDGSEPSMTVATYNDVGLDDITIPEVVIYEEKEYQVTQIKDSAFESDLLLERIVLPKGVEMIGDGAFYSCPELTEIVFSDTIKSIGNSCFAECPKLSEVELPASLQSLGTEVFCNCTSLKKITIPAKITTMGNAVFYGCESLTECSFEDGVVQVGAEMFTNCYELSKVVLPDSITTIGLEAFWYCTSLTEIVLPESLVTIGDKAFYNSGIKNLRIPENVSGVKIEMLEGMEELEEISVSESNKGIYEDIFKNYGIQITTY